MDTTGAQQQKTANRPTPRVARRKTNAHGRPPPPEPGDWRTDYVPTSRQPKSGIPDGFPPTPAEIPRQTDFQPGKQGPGIAQRDPPDAPRRAFASFPLIIDSPPPKGEG